MSGVVNVETAIQVPAFPIAYEPVRFADVATAVSGSGFNVAYALRRLGSTVTFATLLADDLLGGVVREHLRNCGLLGVEDAPLCRRTPRSVVIHAADGSRMVTTDLAGIVHATYPADRFAEQVRGSEYAALTNVQFNVPLLAVAARCGVRVACDVHAISDLEDPHNSRFMQAADVLFMSHERLPCSPGEWIRSVQERYSSTVAVVGLGAGGCLLATRDHPEVRHFSAQTPRHVINTVGAGDALFASFLRYYTETGDPAWSIQRAVLFAGWKIGESGGSRGLLTRAELETLAAQRGL